MLDRLDLSDLERESLNESLQSYERDIVQQCKKLQKRILVAAAIVLDEVDRLGIRDMEMMEMMSFMTDPEKQDELKGMFDVHSEPIQEVAAKLSDINWKTYRKVYQVLPAQGAIDLQERYFREVYRGTADQVFSIRAWIKRAMDLPSVDAAEGPDASHPGSAEHRFRESLVEDRQGGRGEKNVSNDGHHGR